MSRFKLMAFLLAAPWLFGATPGTPKQPWQEGEILSRKTILPSHHHARTSYVYRIKGGGMQYRARFDQPLSLGMYAPLKFSVNHGHLFVQDADGSQKKASILKKSDPSIRH